MLALLIAAGLAAAPEVGPPPAAFPAGPRWAPVAAHTAALFGGMRLSEALIWPDAFPLVPRDGFARFGRSWTQPPEWRAGPIFRSDGDPWALNVFGHGLFGSEVFLKMRQCGHGPLAGGLATAAASAFWEYGVEAFHKRPSGIDLLWTPIGGALLGELRFRLYRAAGGAGAGARIVRAIADPFGEMERGALG